MKMPKLNGIDVSGKHREKEEVEVICNILGIQWCKICSKGKHCFLLILQSEKERMRIENELGQTLLNWAITIRHTTLEEEENRVVWIEANGLPVQVGQRAQ